MDKYKDPGWKMLSILLWGLIILLPLSVLAAETPVMVIEAAKSAIDQARKAGAEQQAAMDDLSAAKSWLAQAEKAYEAANSIMAMVSTAKMKRAKEEEVIYLATMAKIKGMTAEAKAKKQTTAAKLKETQKDLADYQSAIAVMKEKLQEVGKAKEIQAKAEAERKHLEAGGHEAERSSGGAAERGKTDCRKGKCGQPSQIDGSAARRRAGQGSAGDQSQRGKVCCGEAETGRHAGQTAGTGTGKGHADRGR
jgi:hypothetical protein